ncbi:MAG: Uma2 family endonuclease [Lachnospiraceae bacterium]|nr:Uma2 family endonuclease [Lachnospiraceae bacterium]
MPLPKRQDYTIEDIYALPEGQRAELVDGQLYMMSPPNRVHQKLSNRLSQKITNYIDSNHGNCEVYTAPFAVFLDADDKTYVEPDISVVCDGSKLNDQGCNGAPDFIIEIVSPSSRKMDYSTKNALYSNAGVREYWIVDPDKERTTVYRYHQDFTPIIFMFDQDIPVSIYDGLSICIAEML